MALIQATNLTFTYDGSADAVFAELNFQIDSTWRLGLIGRNGRGKTTLLRLLAGQLTPQGRLLMPLTPALFPFPLPDAALPTREALACFAPDTPAWRLLLEWNQLSLPEALLEQPFATLSRGEQTKAQLAALFAREDAYPLIDEPTNHLDLEGRAQVADYLAAKDGFLLVSHDRAFLNRCVDHTLSINRSSVSVQRGNFDTWEQEFNRKNESEQARNDQLRRDVTRLTETARRQAEWSRRCEQGKYHMAASDAAVVDRGYIGARSAALMKRSQAARARVEQSIEEKRGLLHDVERIPTLKLTPLTHPKQVLVDVRDAAVRYGQRTVCADVRLTLERGERIALTGPNGCGKSSVLKTLCGLSDALQGNVRIASGLRISYVPQSTEGLRGDLREWIARQGVDETLFKTILRDMDFGRQQFDKTIEQYSDGQKKKLLLARSLCEQAHLYIWDEPLNYLDVFSRIQLETLLRAAQPTLLLVEHDRAFLDAVCTRSISLGAQT